MYDDQGVELPKFNVPDWERGEIHVDLERCADFLEEMARYMRDRKKKEDDPYG